ncbi:DMT family transporter [Amylibacter sp.]|jgi:drug/metabolite transporter (DMT)-like permease|nr:DMT family transporter [Amylibacter sp.]MDA9243137.1 DMT family transporter [Amylibacter sp.]MDA9926764.1 DMT family transporter [Amylibacter sp.]MDB2337367.1 DMT family transporter [Amylibacter sp.]MDB2472621.1 DMT family transporter [Amylibacter sp.]|tara:strand:+ start:1323 stop:2177 length:855 start_codon:yes stop_codon:yes gene_type:complete
MSPKYATILILSGALCMSFAALFVKLIQNADGFQILFYRGFPQCMMVMIVACFIRRISLVEFFKSIDKTDLILGFTMCIAFSFYIFALLNTSVASALFILSISPVFAALLSWRIIGEIPTKTTWIAILFAMVGVTVMVGADLTRGQLIGNLFAMISAFSFALMLVFARKSKKSDVLTGNFLGAGFAILMAIILAYSYGDGLIVSTQDMLLSFALGAFTIGIGIAFVAWAAPYLPAPNVGVLVLIESVLAPVWVWLFLDMPMKYQEILGGLIILCAVLILSTKRK